MYVISVDTKDDKLFFAFTFPYSYTQVQNELAAYDKEYFGSNHPSTLADYHEGRKDPDDIYYHREIITKSLDDRNVDLIVSTLLLSHMIHSIHMSALVDSAYYICMLCYCYCYCYDTVMTVIIGCWRCDCDLPL